MSKFSEVLKKKQSEAMLDTEEAIFLIERAIEIIPNEGMQVKYIAEYHKTACDYLEEAKKILKKFVFDCNLIKSILEENVNFSANEDADECIKIMTKIVRIDYKQYENKKEFYNYLKAIRNRFFKDCKPEYVDSFLDLFKEEEE
jgi:transcription elongation factor GreA-like protein